jgi:hypothetical protein
VIQCTKAWENIPKHCLIAIRLYVIYSKWTYTIPIFSVSRHFKIYPNLAFLFENKPSGNPDGT